VQDILNPKKTPEEVSQQALESRLLNAAARNDRRLARGELTPPERRPVPRTPAIEAAQVKADRAVERLNEAILKDRMANRSWPKFVYDEFVIEGANLSRAIITSMDFSAIGRQGGVYHLWTPGTRSKSPPRYD